MKLRIRGLVVKIGSYHNIGNTRLKLDEFFGSFYVVNLLFIDDYSTRIACDNW